LSGTLPQNGKLIVKVMSVTGTNMMPFTGAISLMHPNSRIFAVVTRQLISRVQKRVMSLNREKNWKASK
jgi:hypothetical protein